MTLGDPRHNVPRQGRARRNREPRAKSDAKADGFAAEQRLVGRRCERHDTRKAGALRD
jgi:hypothetical protein